MKEPEYTEGPNAHGNFEDVERGKKEGYTFSGFG